MKTQRAITSVATILTGVSLVAVVASQARGEPSMKDKATYNASVASLMGGVANIKNANSNSVRAWGEYLHKLVAIEQLKETLRKETMANDMKAAENFYAMRKANAKQT